MGLSPDASLIEQMEQFGNHNVATRNEKVQRTKSANLKKTSRSTSFNFSKNPMKPVPKEDTVV